jgi:hypothetical protein
MGQVRMASATQPAAGADRYSAWTGAVSSAGLLITFEYVRPQDPFDGPPALVRWLSSKGCVNFKYDLGNQTGADLDSIIE